MNQPLGHNIGNSLEVIECIETLKGNGPKDLTDLCLHIASEFLLEIKKYIHKYIWHKKDQNIVLRSAIKIQFKQ